MKKVFILDHVGIKAGMDKYSLGLMRGLSSNNFNCFLYSNFNSQSNRQVKNLFPNSIGKSPKSLLLFIIGFLKFYRDAFKFKVDSVIIHQFNSNFFSLIIAMFARLASPKLILILHDVSQLDGKGNKFLEALILNKLAHFIIVHNEFSANMLNEKKILKNSNKCKVLRHGVIDTKEDCYLQLDLVNELDKFLDNKKVILFFGQIKRVKGLDLLIKALHLLEERIVLVIAGKDVENEFSLNLKNLINSMNLDNRVFSIIRFIENNEMNYLFQRSDIIALPYREIYQSGVLLSSLGKNCTPLVSSLEPFTEIIFHNRNGIVFKTENQKDLANKVNEYFKNEKILRDSIRNANLKLLEKYSWERVTKGYEQII